MIFFIVIPLEYFKKSFPLPESENNMVSINLDFHLMLAFETMALFLPIIRGG